MSTVPSLPQQPGSVPPRSSNVALGRMDFLSVLWRATLGELYKIRRRAMSKVLIFIGTFSVLLIFSVLGLIYLAAFNASNSQTCQTDATGQTICQPDNTGSKEAAGLDSIKQGLASNLHLPGSLIVAGRIVDMIGMVLLVILAGTIVGGEFGIGTIRLMLTRGPTRSQFLLAKILAILISIVLAVVLLVGFGILVGALYNLATPYGIDESFWAGAWGLHTALFLGLIILGIFLYSMLALCISTLGKATAGGIAGTLLWWLLETVLTPILQTLGLLNRGSFLGGLLTAIPNYFMGNSLMVLTDQQASYLIGGDGAIISTSGVSEMQALITLLVYLVVFIGTAWIVLQKRDVTN